MSVMNNHIDLKVKILINFCVNGFLSQSDSSVHFKPSNEHYYGTAFLLSFMFSKIKVLCKTSVLVLLSECGRLYLRSSGSVEIFRSVNNNNVLRIF